MDSKTLTVRSKIPGLTGICQDNMVVIKLFDDCLFIGQLKPDVDRQQALDDTLLHVETDIKLIILKRMISGLMDNSDMPDDSIPDGQYPYDMER